jgi:hypothetical protein
MEMKSHFWLITPCYPHKTNAGANSTSQLPHHSNIQLKIPTRITLTTAYKRPSGHVTWPPYNEEMPSPLKCSMEYTTIRYNGRSTGVMPPK